MAERITAEDLYHIRTVLDPRISPDGRRVAFVVKRVDRDKNTYRHNIWLAEADGSACRPFTQGDQNDTGPRWSPDGRRILFVSDRENELPQLYIIEAAGGEARRLTDLPPGGIGEVAWAPDGKSAVFAFQPRDERDTKEAAEKRKADHISNPPREITRLRFREEGAGFLPHERHHLWTVDVESGAVNQLTHSENGEGGPRFSPDGRTILYAANRREDPDFEPLFDDLILLPASGGEERKIDAPDGPKGNAVFSPDGQRIAYVGHTDTGDTWGTRNPTVWTVSTQGGNAEERTAEMDRPAGDFTLSDVHSFGAGDAGPAWVGNDRLLFLAGDRGATHLHSVDLNRGQVDTLVGGNRVVMALSATSDGKCALVMGDPMAPAEVFFFDAETGEEPRPLSRLNESAFGAKEVRQPEAFCVSNGEGGEVHGWILTPPGFDPDRKYPMILEIHGGPHTMYGWSFFHEMQYFAAEGFVVVYANPRGSQGYGEAWTADLKGRWGEPDLVDVMAVVDHVLARGYVDEKHMGITGGSYGGFMTAWVIGHTDRFAAAAPQRGVYNLVSMAGTCDFPWDDRYFAGTPWEWAESLRKYSPLTYAPNVTTPTLIIHSEGDLRCPIEQADQYYAALRTLRRAPVKYLRFGTEANHGLSRGGPPDLRLARLDAILGWMKEHLGSAT